MESLNKERNNKKNKLNLSGKLTEKKTVPPFCGLATILTKTNWTTVYFH